MCNRVPSRPHLPRCRAEGIVRTGGPVYDAAMSVNVLAFAAAVILSALVGIAIPIILG